MKTVHGEVCVLSWVTGTPFLERRVTAEVLRCHFFGAFEHHEAEFDPPPLYLEWQQSFLRVEISRLCQIKQKLSAWLEYAQERNAKILCRENTCLKGQST